MKFLRARNLNTIAAREMLVNTLRWRESFNVDSVLKEEFPEEIFGNMGKIYGLDKEKRPVGYVTSLLLPGAMLTLAASY